MVSGKEKSRSKRRVFKRIPSGKSVKRYLPRAPSKAQCGGCGNPLAGVPRLKPGQRMAKTKKRPQRIYGGVLCSKCSRLKIIEAHR